MERFAFILFIMGILLIIAGSIVTFFTALSADTTSGSVVVIVGPIPIIGAWGEHGFALTLIALAIFFTLLIVHVLYFRKFFKYTGE